MKYIISFLIAVLSYGTFSHSARAQQDDLKKEMDCTAVVHASDTQNALVAVDPAELEKIRKELDLAHELETTALIPMHSSSPLELGRSDVLERAILLGITINFPKIQNRKTLREVLNNYARIKNSPKHNQVVEDILINFIQETGEHTSDENFTNAESLAHEFGLEEVALDTLRQQMDQWALTDYAELRAYISSQLYSASPAFVKTLVDLYPNWLRMYIPFTKTPFPISRHATALHSLVPHMYLLSKYRLDRLLDAADTAATNFPETLETLLMSANARVLDWQLLKNWHLLSSFDLQQIDASAQFQYLSEEVKNRLKERKELIERYRALRVEEEQAPSKQPKSDNAPLLETAPQSLSRKEFKASFELLRLSSKKSGNFDEILKSYLDYLNIFLKDYGLALSTNQYRAVLEQFLENVQQYWVKPDFCKDDLKQALELLARTQNQALPPVEVLQIKKILRDLQGGLNDSQLNTLLNHPWGSEPALIAKAVVTELQKFFQESNSRSAEEIQKEMKEVLVQLNTKLDFSAER